jgi:hypothetical protein
MYMFHNIMHDPRAGPETTYMYGELWKGLANLGQDGGIANIREEEKKKISYPKYVRRGCKKLSTSAPISFRRYFKMCNVRGEVCAG